MTPFIWRDRLVKLEDGCFMLSARGRHDDWDFCPAVPHSGQAIAGNCGVGARGGGNVLDIKPVDDNRLSLICENGRFYLVCEWRIEADTSGDRELLMRGPNPDRPLDGCIVVDGKVKHPSA